MRFLGLFCRWATFRLWCASLSTHWAYEYFMLAVIVYSCLSLTVDSGNLDTCSAAGNTTCIATTAFVELSDAITTAIFVFDVALSVVSRGFWGQPQSFFSSGWRVLDAAVVATCVVSSTKVSLRFRALRAARALRALRLLVRLPNLKVRFAVLNHCYLSR